MSTATTNDIYLVAAIVTTVVSVAVLADIIFNRWSHLKKLGHWFRKASHFTIDQAYVTLKIPPPTPIKPILSSPSAAVLAQITDVRSYIGEDLKRTIEAAPHIDLIFDLPKSDTTSWRVRHEPLKVVNTADTVAYDVAIQPRESPLYKAKFEIITRLEKGHPAYAVMDLRAKPSGTYYKEFEALLKFELETSSEDDDFKVRVPIFVRFYDSKKEIWYQTAHEIVYDRFWHESHVHLVQGTTPIKMPFHDVAVPVKTHDGANKTLVKRIMRGPEKLMAWEITREGFPKGYLVEFTIRNQEPKSRATADYKVANEQWHEWYKEWKQQPGGFGGASGDGIDGTLPW